MTAYNYVKKNGIESAEAYPYTNVFSEVTEPCKYNEEGVVFNTKGFKFVTKNDPNAL